MISPDGPTWAQLDTMISPEGPEQLVILVCRKQMAVQHHVWVYSNVRLGPNLTP